MKLVIHSIYAGDGENLRMWLPKDERVVCEFISVSSYWLLTERFELYEAQDISVEPQGLLLASTHAGHSVFHAVPPCFLSRPIRHALG